MTLLTGTYDGESVKSTRFLVETDQVWKIDQSTLAGAVVPEPLLDGTSLSGGSAFVPVRVGGAASASPSPPAAATAPRALARTGEPCTALTTALVRPPTCAREERAWIV
jgi:hypothetical protein